jgi:hypothetical protein
LISPNNDEGELSTRTTLVAKVAIGSLINILKLLTLLLLTSAQLKIKYTFSKIYDTKVIDLSGNGYHAVKDAPGGP